MIIFCAVIKPANPADILDMPTVSHLGKPTSFLLGNIQFKQRWLSFFELSTPAENPYGSSLVQSKYQNQEGPTASKGYTDYQ